MDDNTQFQELRTKIRNESIKKRAQIIWICKPGENSNRGNGIVVLPCIEQVQKFLQQTKQDE